MWRPADYAKSVTAHRARITAMAHLAEPIKNARVDPAMFLLFLTLVLREFVVTQAQIRMYSGLPAMSVVRLLNMDVPGEQV